MEKKKRSLTAVCAWLCLAAALVFGALWRQEVKSHTDLDELWFYSMSAASNRFHGYLEHGSEGDYWYGVAEFQTMVNCAFAHDRPGKTDANAACAAMVFHPERGMEYAAVICDKLDVCVSDSIQWEIQMNELRHALEVK